jgi:glycerol kinase
VAARTGLRLDPYFSTSKIAWLLDHVPDARAKAERGELAFGAVDAFLLWRLTAGAGTTAAFGGAIPIRGIASDRQAALISLQAPPQNLRPFSQMRRKDQNTGHVLVRTSANRGAPKAE